MESERLDILKKESELYKAIQWVIPIKGSYIKKGGYIIKEFGITYPLGKTFFALQDRVRREFPIYNWVTHYLVIVENEKKWLLTRIKYGD